MFDTILLFVIFFTLVSGDPSTIVNPLGFNSKFAFFIIIILQLSGHLIAVRLDGVWFGAPHTFAAIPTLFL